MHQALLVLTLLLFQIVLLILITLAVSFCVSERRNSGEKQSYVAEHWMLMQLRMTIRGWCGWIRRGYVLPGIGGIKQNTRSRKYKSISDCIKWTNEGKKAGTSGSGGFSKEENTGEKDITIHIYKCSMKAVLANAKYGKLLPKFKSTLVAAADVRNSEEDVTLALAEFDNLLTLAEKKIPIPASRFEYFEKQLIDIPCRRFFHMFLEDEIAQLYGSDYN